MRIQEKRFSVPFCVFDDNLTSCAQVVLVFLFSQSDCGGHCRVSYDRISEFTGFASRNSISDALALLQKRGWFYKRKRTNGAQIVQLRIPTRYMTKLPMAEPAENVVQMPKKSA